MCPKTSNVTLCLLLGFQLFVISLSSIWSRNLAMLGFHNTRTHFYIKVPLEKPEFLFAYLPTL